MGISALLFTWCTILVTSDFCLLVADYVYVDDISSKILSPLLFDRLVMASRVLASRLMSSVRGAQRSCMRR